VHRVKTNRNQAARIRHAPARRWSFETPVRTRDSCLRAPEVRHVGDRYDDGFLALLEGAVADTTQP
jgi:hypothetical protein